MKTQQLGVLALSVSLLAATIPLMAVSGCQNTLTALVNELGTACAGLATLENRPATATDCQKDSAAVAIGINNWKNGGPAQEAIEAIQLVENDIGLIPDVSPQVDALILLALGTAQSIIEILDPNAATPAALQARAMASGRSVHLTNPPRSAAAFKAQWNALCTGSVAAAALK